MSEHGIIEAFAAQTSRHPDRLAIADPRRGETATFAQLMKRAERFAGGLRRAGFATGDRLLLAAPDQRMAELKMEPLLSLPPNADDKEVFELFDKYNLRMLTVVDEENRPIGTITVDDVVSKLVKD